MAFTKERKEEIVARYNQWVDHSQATFVLEYSNMNMKAIDAARAKIREAGGEIHVVKNTLFKLVLDKHGMPHPKGSFQGSNIVVFAFSDPPALAKVLSEVTNKSEVFKVKNGYLAAQPISAAEIKALADLPPLPVMRARILGVLLAPAGQLVRTLAEPARSLAGVFKAFSEKDAAQAPA